MDNMRQHPKRMREDTPPVPPDLGGVYSTERSGWNGAVAAITAAGVAGAPSAVSAISEDSAADAHSAGDAYLPLQMVRLSSNPRRIKRTRTEQLPEQNWAHSSLEPSPDRSSHRSSLGAFSSFSSLTGSIRNRSSLNSLNFGVGGSPGSRAVIELRRQGIRGESMDDMDELLEPDSGLDLGSRFRARSSSLSSAGMDVAIFNPLSQSPKRSSSFVGPMRSVLSSLRHQQSIPLAASGSSTSSNASSSPASTSISSPAALPLAQGTARRVSSLSSMGVEPALMQRSSQQMRMLRRSSSFAINRVDSPPLPVLGSTEAMISVSGASGSSEYDDRNGSNTIKPEQLDFLSVAMRRNFAFKSLPAAVTDGMAAYFVGKTFAKGETVIQEGAPGDYFYIVETGTVQVVRSGQNVALRERGDSFGEMALLYNCPRNATLITLTPCVLWMVDRITFRHVVMRCLVGRDLMVAKALKRKLPWLHHALSPEQLTVALRSFKVHEFAKGDTLMCVDPKSTPEDRQHQMKLFVLQEGQVVCVRGGLGGGLDGSSLPSASSSSTASSPELSLCFPHSHGTTLDADNGDSFGGALALFEAALSTDRVLKIDATMDGTDSDWDGASMWSQGKGDTVQYVAASENVIALAIDVTSFRELIDPGQSLVAGLSSPMAAESSCETAAARRQRSQTEVSVIEKTTATMRAAVIRASRAVILRSRHGASGGGAGALSSRNSADATSLTNSSTDHSSSKSPNRPMSLSLGKRSNLKKLNFANLQRVKVLGLGSFGRVELVRYRNAPGEPLQLFALKIQQKANIVASRQTKASMRERLLLEQCDHQFICNLHATFADQHLLYMLLECVRGGELFQLLSVQPSRRVPFTPARFYAACVIDALSYMHEVPRRIMYRDIKPENLLLDHMGYIKIVDFGFAKRLTEETAFRTYTFCGTPDYIAPEMLSGNGYDQGVDVWAVGVLIFEMIFGYAPFGELPAELRAAAEAKKQVNSAGSTTSAISANDSERASGDFAATIMRPPERHTPQVTMKGIMFDDVMFPAESVLPTDGDNGAASRDIILSLLVKRPEQRLGCAQAGGIRNAYRHEWFEGFDFQAMRERRMPSPWKPELDEDHEVVEPAENYAWDFPIKSFDGDHSWCEGW